MPNGIKLPSTTLYPYRDVSSVTRVTLPSSYGLFCHEESLAAAVYYSENSLNTGVEQLEQNTTVPEEIKYPLLKCVQRYRQSVAELNRKGINGYIGWLPPDNLSGPRYAGWLQPDNLSDPLHKEVAGVRAFAQALEYALKGWLTERQSKTLDIYFPLAQERWDYPSCARRVAVMTGVGCAMLGVIVGAGGVATNSLIKNGFIDDENAPYYAIAAESMGAALVLLEVGVTATQCIAERCCKTKPAADAQVEELCSEERRLLVALNTHMERVTSVV